MLGFGWYVWDEKCPTGRRCVPPIYGNFDSTYIKVPENSPRTNGTDQAEAVSAPWKAGIPRGNDVCIKFGSRGNKKDVAPLKKRTTPQQHNTHHHHDKNEIFTKSNTDCSCNPPPSYVSQYKTQSNLECDGSGSRKKKLYNVMWDPKIARGPTLFQFEEAQRAKWKRQVDSHRALLIRDQIRRRRMKMKETEYLDARSNPMRRIVYPTVTIKKEPLTNSSFALFLTEQCEKVESMNASQGTDDVSCRGPPYGHNKKSFSSGISAGVQTDENSIKREDTEDWIASTMTEKIPQQAVLEVQEEAELEAIRGEQRRYELVFLYRKWQEMKEDQWNEYLRTWNELRMREILDQNVYLQEQQERILVIGFCRNAISSCFHKTFEGMKQDGFINEHGVPYEELEEINDSLDYQDETETKFARKQLLARKVIDSTLINAVVQRFSQHMFDDYGRPHGAWLSIRGRHSTIDYDIDLERYLEGRWMNRRERSSEDDSLNALYSETSLLDIFDYYKESKKAIGEVRQTFKEGEPDAATIIKNLISKQRLGRQTGPSAMFSMAVADNKMDGDENHHGHRFSSTDDDVSMLYKRQTRWSKLERDDENHHHQQKQQQQQQQRKISSLGNNERGASLVFDAKRTHSGTMGKSTGGARFPEEKGEVDSDKLGEPDGGNETRRSKLSSVSVKSGRQSQAPRARFE